MGEGAGSGGGSRGGAQPSAARLAALLGARSGRPRQQPQEERPYPVPPHQPDPVSDEMARYIEQLEFDEAVQRFMDRMNDPSGWTIHSKDGRAVRDRKGRFDA